MLLRGEGLCQARGVLQLVSRDNSQTDIIFVNRATSLAYSQTSCSRTNSNTNHKASTKHKSRHRQGLPVARLSIGRCPRAAHWPLTP